MLNLLESSIYPLVRHLFEPLTVFQPMCTAVLEGIWPGKIWVDNPVQPRSATLVSFLGRGGAAWCFLAGRPENAIYNSTLNKAIFEDKIAGEDVGAFLFMCSSEDWNNGLEAIGSPRQPAPMLRHHYICHSLIFDWRRLLPEGYAILPLKTALLEHADLQLPEQVKSTLEKWNSIDNDQFQDGSVNYHGLMKSITCAG